MQHRAIKLGETITGLIERGGYSRNRQAILDSVGISAAALSQYARNQTRPSFQKLVALAEFFGVSLDYLVYGEPIGTVVDHGPLARYVNQALADVQARASQHTALVGRIGRMLADRIDNVAKELADAPTAIREGLIQDDEAQRLEVYCLRADILAVSLALDVISMPGGDAAPGPFLEVVATNLARGRAYRFLMAGGQTDHRQAVTTFRSMLETYVGGDHVRQNCLFRHTSQPAMTGAGIYQLDVNSLRLEQPALFAQVSHHLSEDDCIGYVVRPNSDSNSDMLMSRQHTTQARRAFEALWAGGARL
ncbi:MAG TPA: helix-turn-helix domain-containing protein [Pseudonocardiaceae bacterium]|nr:helix-turn-helix domain-containing protein [Pseudonocardiaceae bacterium]